MTPLPLGSLEGRQTGTRQPPARRVVHFTWRLCAAYSRDPMDEYWCMSGSY